MKRLNQITLSKENLKIAIMKLTKASKIISLLILTGIISFSVISCKNKCANTDALKVTNKTIKQEIKEYTYPINSVFDVTNMLIRIEASYVIGITNDPANVDKYFSEQSKAFNLGVYTADLAYSTTYNERADVQRFFKATEALASSLSITSAFSTDLPAQIESNINNKDKLVAVVTKMSQDAYSYLNNQGRTELSYLILAGTAIEGLYLTSHLSESTYQNPEIVKAILYHKDPLMKLEKLMEGGNTELTKKVLTNIKSINAIYAEVNGTTSITKQQIEQLNSILDKIRKENI
jgi:hypothetical protein